jgi:predicted nucleic acid-binding protein
MKLRTFFIDSSFIYALLNRRDQFHDQAITVLSKLQDDDFFVLTDAIILESCSLLAALGARKTIVGFLDDIMASDQYNIFYTDEDLFYRAYDLFRSYEDKEWSLVDCLSSLVMQEQSIQLALTSDHHFEQMGFLAVLRHPDLI